MLGLFLIWLFAEPGKEGRMDKEARKGSLCLGDPCRQWAVDLKVGLSVGRNGLRTWGSLRVKSRQKLRLVKLDLGIVTQSCYKEAIQRITPKKRQKLQSGFRGQEQKS